MLTENDVRDLLRQAGETIEVDPTRPQHFAPAPRRLWPVLGAAAAVVLVATTGWLVSSREDGRPEPVTPVVTDGVPDGTVPSVFGHDRASATRLLEGLGYAVEVREKEDCEQPDRAIGTVPATGTPVAPGAVVTLEVAAIGPALDCAFARRPEVWQFLDFANQRGPAPGFAPSVTVVVDGGQPVVLDRAAAERAASWGEPSALTELRAASNEVLRVSGDGGPAYLTPTLEVVEGTPPTQECGVPRPAVAGQREAVTLRVEVPEDGVVSCPTTVAIYSTGGLIDTVVTYTDKPTASGAAAETPVPHVTAMGFEKARATVTEAGFTAVREELPTCSPRPGVVEQAPESGHPYAAGERVTLVVEVTDTGRDCAALRSAAESLVAFAAGEGPAPAFADQVRLHVGYAFQGSITAGQAAGRDAWDLCPEGEVVACPVSALRVLAGQAVAYGVDLPLHECLVDLGGLRFGLGSESWLVIHPRTTPACAEQWVVQLWVGGSGRITDVNVLVSEG